MTRPEFEPEERRLQTLLRAEDRPVPPTTAHQFAAAVRLRAAKKKNSIWTVYFPMAASAAAAVALFVNLPTDPAAPNPNQAPALHWSELQVEDGDEELWRGDVFDSEGLSDNIEIEEELFAELEITDDLQVPYEPSSFALLDDLDDEALDRLDRLLNTALNNKGG